MTAFANPQLLFHANVPPRFWPDVLATASLLLNIRPCRPRWNYAPHHLLFGTPSSYDDLRIFGCLCYPSTADTSSHKLAPRSVACIFIGYPSKSKGYRCYDPVSHRVFTSRHVYFDEHVFPFQQVPPVAPVDDVAALPPLPRRSRAALGPHPSFEAHHPMAPLGSAAPPAAPAPAVQS